MFRISTFSSTPTALLITSLTTLLVPLILLTGCGVNPDKPVYDTVNNPDNFPDQAVSLAENIQSGQLEESKAIIDAFSDLYSENPNLLGNDEWKEVVLKLGIKLRHNADQLVKDGIGGYSKAAGLYHVAAFARPNDSRLQAMNNLFSLWAGEASDSLVALDRATQSGNPNLGILAAEIEQLKRFQFADSLSTEFARLYLHNLLFEPFISNRNRANAIIDSLSQSEQAFLNSIGVSDRLLETTLGRFENPIIDLVAVDLVSLSGNEYRAEVYFLPREPISNDLTVAFWVDGPDSVAGIKSDSENYFTYGISPDDVSSKWPTDQVSIAYGRLSFDWPVSEVMIGLYSQTEKEVRFLPVISSSNSTTEDDSTRVSSNLIRVSLEPIQSD